MLQKTSYGKVSKVSFLPKCPLAHEDGKWSVYCKIGGGSMFFLAIAM